MTGSVTLEPCSMDASALATTFGAQLPSWVLSELADVPETLPTDEDRVRLANRLA